MVTRQVRNLEARARSQVTCGIFGGPVPVAVRSKAYVCGRLPADIVGSNSTGGIGVCLSFVRVVCCQVEVSATR